MTNLQTMYPAVNNSPQVSLTGNITAAAAQIPLSSVAALPAAPGLVTIGVDDDAELIRYNGISGNALTGCERGFSGTTARVWEAGEAVYRAFTAYDHETFKANIEALNTGKLDTDGNGSNVTAAFSQASTKANITTGEKLSVIFGKLMKWYASFGAAAWMNTGTTSSTVALGNHTHTAAAVGAVPTTRKVNGKALSYDVTLSASDVGARAGDWLPTLAQVGGGNENLARNWYWARPVNQRNITTQVWDESNIDGWLTYSAGTNTFTLEVVPNSHLHIVAGSHWLQQGQRYEYLPNGVYTLSVKLLDGTIHSKTVIWDNNNSVGGDVVAGLGLFLANSIDYPYYHIGIGAGYTFDIVAVKIEEGTVSTLANDPPPDPQQELTKCQRYYEVVEFVLYRSTATAFGITVPYKATKRIVGTTRIVSAQNAENSISYYNGVGWTDVPVGYKEDYTHGVFVYAENANLKDKTVKFKVFADSTL